MAQMVAIEIVDSCEQMGGRTRRGGAQDVVDEG